MAILLGLICLAWTMEALAQTATGGGPLAQISSEAIFAAIISASLLIVGGYTARNDRDMREFRKTVQEQFRAVGMEQRQQQTEMNLLSERVLREYPTKQEVKEWRLEMRESFDKLENLLRGGHHGT
jgi:hypothetical protein